MALSAVATTRQATAEPGDIFTISAPGVSDAPPSATPLADGDASVSTQTGAMVWSYPIKVAPGRRNATPSLQLSYNSQGAIYGTLAAQWTLSGLPIITRDTSSGRLLTTTKSYSSSLAGGRPLVQVTEPGGGVAQYRAQHDTSWVRYERHESGDFFWRASSPDGSTYFFGHHGAGDDHTTGCAIVSDEYAPLTRTLDEFGNSVDYIYRPGADGECRIAAITWGQNAAAGVGHFAAVEFQYAATPKVCAASNIPVGSQTSYRTGIKIVTGASQLDAIRIAAFDPVSTTSVTPTPIPPNPAHTRTIALTYNTTATQGDICAAQHAAYRALLKIQETAVGVDSPLVSLPAIELTYNSALPRPTTAATMTNPWRFSGRGSLLFKDSYNLGWGYRFTGINDGWPTVEAMMLDLDGDGLIDRLVNEPFQQNGGTRFCQARW